MISYVQIATGVVIGITLTSLFFLSHLTMSEQEHLMRSSRLRFICFVVIHLYIISMMVIFLMVHHTYSFVKWGFALSFVIASIGTAVEIILSVYHINNNNGYNLRTVMPTELAYLNCYFLIYMYSLICCFLTGLYLFLTECCMCVQEYQIRKAISDSIHIVPFTGQMIQKQCSICITHLSQEENLLQIKCKHVFHEECLLEWIKINQTCPTCRFNVFEDLNREDVGVEIIDQPAPNNPNQ